MYEESEKMKLSLIKKLQLNKNQIIFFIEFFAAFFELIDTTSFILKNLTAVRTGIAYNQLVLFA